MSEPQEQISIRLPVGQLKRSESLRKAIVKKHRPLAALGTVTRSTVLKLAIDKGLEALEDEYK